ncbi:hypothetical protein D3C75_1245420 [compost metagenome]
MQLTAEELYIHRNTLRYKLDHISRLLDTSFSDSEKMLGYYISYKIADYCQKSRKRQNPSSLPMR